MLFALWVTYPNLNWNILNFSYITSINLWMFLMNYFYGTSKTILVLYWAHFAMAIWQTFVSISHLCWVCRHQKFCRVSSDIICRQKNFLKQPVFGFCNSLLYSLEESRRLRILISWILIWPQNLFHFEDVPI